MVEPYVFIGILCIEFDEEGETKCLIPQEKFDGIWGKELVEMVTAYLKKYPASDEYWEYTRWIAVTKEAERSSASLLVAEVVWLEQPDELEALAQRHFGGEL